MADTALFASAPYLSSPTLQRAKKNIQEPFDGKSYEHHVGTYMGTLLKNVFCGEPWALTPEKKDDFSKKIPDFVIGKLEDNELFPHLFVEIKKKGGDRFEKALNQTVEDIAFTMDHWGSKTKEMNRFEAFVIVQRGLDIGFFEYYNGADDLRENGIPHFRGCVSLTQDTPEYRTGENKPAVVPSTTPGLKTLMFDDERLRSSTDPSVENIRKDAWGYPTPCIFNINEHEYEINLMMSHMLAKKPRESI
jgi:hypothetical protein